MLVYHVTAFVLFILAVSKTNGKFIRGPYLTNWTDAKAFCDEQHHGLATITDAISLGAAQTECFKEGFSAMGCWFGLSAVLEQEHSTIVDWTVYGPGVPDAANWNGHRGFAAENKIYLLGYTDDAWVLDLDTQIWTTDSSVTLN
eukprot:469449_1